MVIARKKFELNISITGSIMARLYGFVGAGFIATVLLAGLTPASAGRQVQGGDVAKMLTGKAFSMECVDGTTGRGQVSSHGLAQVSYRRPSDTHEENDNAMVRVRGVEICLAWKQFGGGGDGCYPVSEEARGRFRLGAGPLWCDIVPKF